MQSVLAARRRQRGAIAIMFGLSMLVLFGFIALALDLGRTYLVRTELQNAADAAALAGARQLDQTLAGVTSATTYAVNIAQQNKFNFGTTVTLTSANLSVGNCPDDSCMVAVSSITSDALATGMTFLKVDIPSGNLATFFAVVPTTAAGSGSASTSTYGRAVAGRFVNDITPIGICAIKDAAGASRPKGEALPGTNELAQFGFRRGASYNVFELNPLGGSSNPYLLDPIDAYPGPCASANSSANVTAPFVCSGSSAVLVTTPGTVYGNTGVSANKIEKALNSRFNIYNGSSVCIPGQSPPDTNIKSYDFTAGVNWMTPTPTRQSMMPPEMPVLPATTVASAGEYGVLWSYSRAVSADNSVSPPKPGPAFAATAAAWAPLYPSLTGAPAPNANFPAATQPYADPAHSTPPAGNPGTPNRRVLNLAIANCPAITGSGGCQVIPVLGIGRFFMQVPADFSAGTKKLQVEFAGLIDPIPTADIKLYR